MLTLRERATERGHQLELMQDDKSISGLEVVNLRLRIGDVPVQLGGIAGVYTRRGHRMKGYSRQVLERSIAFMREQGYHMGALFGIPNYYTKFGYVPAFVGSEMTVATRDAEDAAVRFASRPFRVEDAPAVVALYEANNHCRTGTIVRGSDTWTHIHLGAGWTDRVDVTVITEGERVIGYFSHNLDAWRFGIGEVGYESPDVLSTILGLVGRMAVDMRVEKIVFHLPPDNAFARYCRRHGCEMKIIYPRYSSGMARIIRQDELLEAVRPLLARRLEEGGMAEEFGSLVLATELGDTTLQLGRGSGEQVLRMPQSMLAQFLLGYDAVGDLLFESGIRIDPALLPLLECLFPAGYPYIWTSDRF